MALISEVVAGAAEVLNIPLPTVAMYARVLRENDLISKKGRGRGAAHATPLDAARLLISLMATPSPSQAADCVRDFGALVENNPREVLSTSNKKRKPFTIDEAYGLPRQHTFEEAFAAIVRGFSEERFARSFASAALPTPGRKGMQRYDAPRLEIDVHDTALGAGIALNGHVYSYTFAPFINCGVGEPLNRAADQYMNVIEKYRRGIFSRRTITIDSLRPIARVVNGGEFDVNVLLKERSR